MRAEIGSNKGLTNIHVKSTWIKKFESQFLLNKPLIKHPRSTNVQSKPNSNRSAAPLDFDKDIRDVYRPSVLWVECNNKDQKKDTKS